MEIQVTDAHGKKISIMMERGQSVKDLSQRISEELGIPVDHQTLVCDRRTLDKERKLADYNLSPQGGVPSNVQIVEKSHGGGSTLIVKVEGKEGRRLLFSLDPEKCTVAGLKRRIHKETGVKPDWQEIRYGEQKLTGLKRTLQDYKIKHKSEVTLKVVPPSAYDDVSYDCNIL